MGEVIMGGKNAEGEEGVGGERVNRNAVSGMLV